MQFIVLTDKKYKSKVPINTERINSMYEVPEDKEDMEDAYTVIYEDNGIHKVVESMAEILQRMGAELV